MLHMIAVFMNKKQLATHMLTHNPYKEIDSILWCWIFNIGFVSIISIEFGLPLECVSVLNDSLSLDVDYEEDYYEDNIW